MELLFSSSVWDVHNSGASMHLGDDSVCKKTKMDEYYKTFGAHRGSS